MQLKLITAIFTALAAVSVNANPIEQCTEGYVSSEARLGTQAPEVDASAPRSSSDFFAFQHYNFGGQFAHWSNPDRFSCINVPPALQGDVSSLIVGPNLQCRGFTIPGCAGTAAHVFTGRGSEFGNYPDLRVFGLNDRLFSFACSRI